MFGVFPAHSGFV